MGQHDRAGGDRAQAIHVGAVNERGGRATDAALHRARPARDQYTRFFGLIYSMSSVSVNSWTGR